MAKYYRIVGGREVAKSNNFDKLQDLCDAEMEGFVIEAKDYYEIRAEAILDTRETEKN